MSLCKLNCSRVVVTGASGFLGRQLIPQLLRIGHHVMGVDTKPDAIGPVENYIHLQRNLFPSFDQIRAFLSEENRCNRTIFHLAGLANARLCEKEPSLAFELNVNSTFMILELCRAISGAQFVFPSTGNVYGDRLDRPASESDPVYPNSVYTATKLAAENLIQCYAKSFKVSSIIVRMSNVYGPHVSEETVIGKILGQLYRGEQISVNDTRPVRDFIFSFDVIDAFVRVYPLIRTNSCMILNISTGEGKKIRNIIEAAAKLYHADINANYVEIEDDRVSTNILSNEKLKSLTDWTPPTSIIDGLKKSYDLGIEQNV